MPRRTSNSERKPPFAGVSREDSGGANRHLGGIALVAISVVLVMLGVASWRFLVGPDEPQTDPRTSARRTSPPGNSNGPPSVPSPSVPSPAPVVIELPIREASGSTYARAVDTLAEKQDVRKDQWRTEVLADQVVARLSVLDGMSRAGHTSRTIDTLVGDDFVCQPLRPHDLTEVYRDDRIVVRRRLSSPAQGGTFHTGGDGLRAAIRQLEEPLDFAPKSTKFKLFRVRQEAEYFTTWIRYEGSSRGKMRSVQQRAVWVCSWTYPVDEPPDLLRIDIESYEEAESEVPGGKLFVDCTESAIGANRSYQQQIVPGVNHWLARVPREFMSQFGHNGIAVGDVNGDRLDDVYVSDSGGLPNRLYLQQKDGTARDVSSDAGVDFLDDSSGALLLDLDNDGDQDLVVATDPILQVAENDGRGRFLLREPIKLNTDALSLSAADFDSDGDLDIYVCGYNVRQREPTNRGLPFPLPYHDAKNGGRNVLLRNEGELRFVDATRDVGLDVGNSRFSMAASWEDFDDDGDQDIYVANDFGPNNLFRNEGGRFTDVAAVVGVQDHASGMSVSWSDYNRDGRMDLYVGNMFSAAGNRVTYQRRFEEGKSPETVSLLRRMARGNTLFANIDRGGRTEFRDVSLQEAVDMGRWAWSSKFLDFTNDGWPDLIVANGYVTGSDTADL